MTPKCQKPFLLRVIANLVVVAVLVGAIFWFWQIYPRRVAHAAVRLPQGSLAIQHARVYVAPGLPPLDDATVLITDGRIAHVGAAIPLPPTTQILPCDRCIVMAGFWNAHVHFTQGKWAGAERKSAAELNAQLADMLLSRGFTTVADLGSNLSDTLPLRRRIESGELNGPLIYTAGGALYPPNGIPFYLRDTLPRWLLPFLSTPATAESARRAVDSNLKAGADLTKLFTGSYIKTNGKLSVLPMPLEIATAAVEETHAQGRLVFAHPSDLAGTRIAIESGVDVLAHASDSAEGIDQALLQSEIDKRMAMIPTLKMFATTVTTNPAYLNPIYAEVRKFHSLGGQLIFGTDVGYMTDYSTQDEFVALGKSGLAPTDILAMLTTNPAARFGVSGEKGTIAPGKLGDLTILAADPMRPDPATPNSTTNLKAFSSVLAVIRSGKVVYQRP